MRRLLAACALLLPLPALAEGVAVSWSGPSGRGDLVPSAPTRVRLVSERLHIRLDADGQGYLAVAEYLLANPGPATELDVRFPVEWYPDISADGDFARDEVPGAAAYAATVQLGVPGRTVPCALSAPERVRPRELPPWERPADFPRLEAWCTARVSVPGGDEIPLTLAFLGQLRFVDMESARSPFTEFGERRLRHLLAPAGRWAGPPGRLEIEIELGAWEGLLRVALPLEGWRAEPGRLRYRAEGPALERVSLLEAVLDSGAVLSHRERVGRVSRGTDRLEARGSGGPPPRGGLLYGPANVLDGRAETAWCTRRGRGGEEPWIELAARDVADLLPAGCGLAGYVLTPGYVRSQGAYARNDRARSVRLGPCGGTGGGATVRIEPAARHDAAAVLLEPPPDDPLRRAAAELRAWSSGRAGGPAGGAGERPSFPACVRLTILEVEPGQDRDTCVSEFRPVVHCR